MGLTFWLLTEVWEPGRFFTHFGLLSFSLRHTITHTDTWTQRPTLLHADTPPIHTQTRTHRDKRRDGAQRHSLTPTQTHVQTFPKHTDSHTWSHASVPHKHTNSPPHRNVTHVCLHKHFSGPSLAETLPALQPRAFSYSKWGSECPAFQEIHSYASLRKKSSSPIFSWVLSS